MRKPVLLVLLAVGVGLAPGSALGAPAGPSAPAFGWPLAGRPVVSRAFSPPRTAWGPGHRGVDLDAAADAPVLAAGPGRVTYAGLLAGRGVVVVSHAAGLRTTYEPVTPAVRVGSEVGRGDLLGTLTTGHASCRQDAVCLHWGLLRGDTYLDPLVLVGGHAVRLLPLHSAERRSVAATPPRPWSTGPSPGAVRPAGGAAAGTGRREGSRSGLAALGAALVLATGGRVLHVRPGH